MIDIIPKKAPESQLLNVLFYISLLALALVIISFFVSNSFIRNYQGSLQKWEEKLVKLNTPENLSLKKEILNYQSKIQDFNQLIGQHRAVSNSFNFIEKNSHPEIWFSQFEVDSQENKIRAAGQAKSFESLGQQILILKGENLVESVQLEKVSMAKGGGVAFTLLLSLNPQIFKPQYE